jgi:hypothetical protein
MVDNPPVVSSITRADANPTNADSVSFTVMFSKNVTGVDKDDFIPHETGTLTGGSISDPAPVSGSVYTVTVSGYSGEGTLRLDLIDHDDSII